MMKSFSAHEIAMMPDWSELRVTKGLSLHRISDETNIPVRKLEAIERHDFETIGIGPFAVGYIRSYAKMLKEDPEIFVQVYKDAIRPEQEESPAITQSMKIVARRHGQVWQKISLLHIVGVALASWVVVVIVMRDEDTGPAPLADEDREIAATLEPMPTKMEDIVQTVAPSQEFAQRTVGAEIVPMVSQGSGIERQNATTTAREELDGIESEPANGVPNANMAPSYTAQTASTALEGMTTQEVGSGEDVLIFSFDEDCWIEVKTADNRVLIAELKRKGDNLRLFGQAPFNILLGNARSVSLTLNGESVSIEPVEGRKTLRFTARG